MVGCLPATLFQNERLTTAIGNPWDILLPHCFCKVFSPTVKSPFFHSLQNSNFDQVVCVCVLEGRGKESLTTPNWVIYRAAIPSNKLIASLTPTPTMEWQRTENPCMKSTPAGCCQWSERGNGLVQKRKYAIPDSVKTSGIQMLGSLKLDTLREVREEEGAIGILASLKPAFVASIPTLFFIDIASGHLLIITDVARKRRPELLCLLQFFLHIRHLLKIYTAENTITPDILLLT